MVFSWIDGQKNESTSTWNQGVRNGARLGAERYRFEARLQSGVRRSSWAQGWGALLSGPDQVSSRGKILRTVALLQSRSWAREIIMKIRRGALHSKPLTDTWSDFLSGEREGREIIVERLKDKAVPCPWQVQRRLMQAVTNTFRCGAY
jgi:hypothetical protein